MSSELAEVLLGLNNQQNKMYHFMTCVQNRNRLMDVENKLLVTKQRCIWGEINQELQMNRYPLLYIRWASLVAQQ